MLCAFYQEHKLRMSNLWKRHKTPLTSVNSHKIKNSTFKTSGKITRVPIAKDHPQMGQMAQPAQNQKLKVRR